MIIGYRSSPRGVFNSAVRADYLGQEKFGTLPIYRTSDANINRYAKAKHKLSVNTFNFNIFINLFCLELDIYIN